jgi:hypothetical protein
LKARLRSFTSLLVAGALLALAPALHAQAASPAAAATPPTAVKAPPIAAPKAPPAPVPNEKKADAPPADANVVAKPEGTTADVASATTRQSAILASLVVKVSSATDTVVELRQYVATIGGFPSLITNNELVLKIPPEHLSAALARIGKAGLVMQKSLAREDLSLDIAKLEGQLESKRAILAELRRFFDTSDVAATLAIEKNMTDLVVELESVKGKLRVLRERAQWVVIQVNFQFKPRDRVTHVVSPFQWLNTVNLERFLAEFR